jgi:hypothetical protein
MEMLLEATSESDMQHRTDTFPQSDISVAEPALWYSSDLFYLFFGRQIQIIFVYNIGFQIILGYLFIYSS